MSYHSSDTYLVFLDFDLICILTSGETIGTTQVLIMWFKRCLLKALNLEELHLYQ